ncbi:MAG: VacJ family lipoprotein [Proteobacteria bacterium]|nr:VacJ family lipoprotein [Pseudomonadota bacterium]
MTKKRLYRLSAAFLIAIFAATGCAHKPVKTSFASPDEKMLVQKPPVTNAGAQQISPDSAKKEADEFFEDEFEEIKVQLADPLAPWNRAMYHLNDKLYFCVLKPLAVAYRELTPTFLRTGVKNFFHNILTPVRLVNCILQGKGHAAETEITRFVMNSTVGVLGLVNVADSHPRLTSPDEEDLGQTLGRYGIGNGFYIVWPLLGPSTLRDSVGMAGDFFLNPISYVDPSEAELGLKSFEKVNNTSFQIGTYEAIKKAAIDPYLAIRDIYFQYRQKKVEK